MADNDLYNCFEELARHERVGVDYRIEQRFGDPSTLILAVHGGPIERHTDLVATEIAGEDLSFYALIGMRRRHNKKHLHIPSERFREPRAMEMVKRAHRVVSIHGEEDEGQEYIMPGGLDDELRDQIVIELDEAGFTIEATPKRLRAEDPCNICNCGTRGGGVQLELSSALRKAMSADEDKLKSFAQAVRNALGARS